MNTEAAEMGLFIGRFHPLLVHMPIGLITLVFVLEVLGRWRRFEHATAANGIILVLAAPAAACSAVCGWLLSDGGGYDQQLLAWHKWLGVGVAAACALALLLRWMEQRAAYGVVLTATCLGLVVASHFGGSLTHGSDYLTRYAPEPLRGLLAGKGGLGSASKSPEEALFASTALPILERTCVNCHGPEKAKSDLRLDTLAAVRKGGKNGPVFAPGKSATSPLVQRLLLPPDHDDHMPPDGKPQPTADEIALLKRWIDAGATSDQPNAESEIPTITKN